MFVFMESNEPMSYEPVTCQEFRSGFASASLSFATITTLAQNSERGSYSIQTQGCFRNHGIQNPEHAQVQDQEQRRRSWRS
jgi:hypothetical protein